MGRQERSGQWATLSRDGYKAAQESECRELLKILRERAVALSSRRYTCGNPIHQEEERGNSLYVLVEGVVKLFGSYSGGRNFVSLVGPWEFFGHLDLAKEPVERAYYAEAITDCEVVKVPKIFVERAMRQQPEVALKLITLQQIRLAQYEELLLGCLLPRKTEVRLANLLMILVQKFGGHPGTDRLTIGLRMTHQDLAEMVASTRESVSNNLSALRNRKMIEMARGNIKILNPEGLTKLGRF